MFDTLPPDLKRVVLVSNCAESVGGIKTFMSVLAPWLHERGVHVEFVSLNPPSRQFQRDPRFSYFDMRTLRRWSKHAPPSRDTSFVGKLKRLVRMTAHPLVERWMQRRYVRHFSSYGPETTVIFTQVFAATALAEAGWRPLLSPPSPTRSKIIGQWHSSYAGALRYPIVDEHRVTFSNADRFLLLTSEDARDFALAGCTETGVMPNPIHAPKLQRSRLRRAVAICRFYPEKQLDLMVRAWDQATRDMPEWRLELYGYGYCEQKIQAEIARLQAGGRVALMGPTLDPNEVLASSMLHLQTSLYEGFPYVILEASVQGTPTIAYECSPGVRELIPEGAGWLVPPQDEAALVETIRRALSDADALASRGALAAEHARLYSADVVLPRWLSLLRELYD